MNTLADRWKEFEAECIPEDAELDQRRSMQLAFYAGAAEMDMLQDTFCEMSDAAHDACYEGVLEEIQRFFLETDWEEEIDENNTCVLS